ncbi:uncharacterized protein LOC106170341 [Lingula anatina]|uniref:Uncharacterized protein LOC106170341 n=1 Tax=Lingula anatina TaxID=7574 RepID=A0A1S3J5Q7_LINAN|nr:uncharacterized protein LOC106170341 [Lingula anatina]|eukprot:XP_013405638.1 uncharacterized protein LOC106170341 [Lingula anatina]
MSVIPPLIGYTNDNSTSLFSACSSTEAIGTPPLACGDNTRCVRNPLLFTFIVGSPQACLCPLTTVPLPNGTCQNIQGSSCQNDQDCNTKTFDCIGLNSLGLPQIFVEFFTPIVLLLCQLTVEYNFQVPQWACVEDSCNLVGTGALSITPGLVPPPGRRKREVSNPPETSEGDQGSRLKAVLSRKTRSEAKSSMREEFLSMDNAKSREKRAPLPTVACTLDRLAWNVILNIFALGNPANQLDYSCAPITQCKKKRSLQATAC